jgi:hypothetical protein
VDIVTVRRAEYRGDRIVAVEFSDGALRELRIRGDLHGALSSLNDEEFLAQVDVDPVSGTLTWPGGIDLDPLVLRGAHTPVGDEVFDPVDRSATAEA